MEHLTVRQRRLRIVIDEPVRARVVLARCVIGLIAIALISIIGLRRPIDDFVPALISASAASAPGIRADASLQHRKLLYDKQHGRIKEATAVDGPAPTGN